MNIYSNIIREFNSDLMETFSLIILLETCMVVSLYIKNLKVFTFIEIAFKSLMLHAKITTRLCSLQ